MYALQHTHSSITQNLPSQAMTTVVNGHTCVGPLLSSVTT